MRRNYTPSAIIEVKGIVPLVSGGTSADNAPEARENLGLVPRFQIGENRGPVPLTPEGLIDPIYLQGLPTATIEVDGPDNLDVGETGTYQITNFDSRITYNVEEMNGEATLNHDVITYTAPLQSLPHSGFEINGLTFDIIINEVVRIPNTPSITSPVNDTTANLSSQLFIASAWSTDFPEDSLQAVKWQIATDSAFTNLVVDVTKTTGLMDRHNLENILPGTDYFVRVAHVGFYGYTSGWSSVRKFTRPPEQKPLTPTIQYPSVNGDLNVQTFTLTTSAFTGTAPGDTHLTSDIQMATDAAFTNIAYQSLDDAVKKTSWSVNLVSRDTAYYIRVRHNGSSGWKSDWSASRVVTYVPIEKPETPTIVAPAVNGIIGNTNVTVQGSPFVGTAPNETHASTSWRFSLFSDFSTLLGISETSATKLTSISVTLPVGQTVYIDVTYHGASGWSSDSSSARTLLVDYPLQPTILVPTNNNIDVPENVTFVSSDFEMASGNGGGGSYGVIWQVASEPAFVNIVASTNGTPVDSNVSWKPTADFNFGFNGYVRTRHQTNTGQQSSYSPVVAFTIRENNVAYKKTAVSSVATAGVVDHVLVTRNGEDMYHITGSGTLGSFNANDPGLLAIRKYDISGNSIVFEEALGPLPFAIFEYLRAMVNTDPPGQQPGDPDDVASYTVSSAYIHSSNNYLHLCVHFKYKDSWASGDAAHQTFVITYDLDLKEIVDYSGTGDPVVGPDGSTNYRSDFIFDRNDGFVYLASREPGETNFAYSVSNVISGPSMNLGSDYRPTSAVGEFFTEAAVTLRLFGDKSGVQYSGNKILTSGNKFLVGGVTERNLPTGVLAENSGAAATPRMIGTSENLAKIAIISPVENNKIILFTL